MVKLLVFVLFIEAFDVLLSEKTVNESLPRFPFYRPYIASLGRIWRYAGDELYPKECALVSSPWLAGGLDQPRLAQTSPA